jgi:hypothetical protein
MWQVVVVVVVLMAQLVQMDLVVALEVTALQVLMQQDPLFIMQEVEVAQDNRVMHLVDLVEVLQVRVVDLDLDPVPQQTPEVAVVVDLTDQIMVVMADLVSLS